MYMLVAFLFALLFYAAGQECYTSLPKWDLGQMFWLSVHMFSTLGFGPIVPSSSCAGVQVLLLAESFCSLVVSSCISASIIAHFLRPRPRIRFSEKALVSLRGLNNTTLTSTAVRAHLESGRSSTDGDTEEYITFRMASEEPYGALRDVRIAAQVDAHTSNPNP